MSEKLLYNGQNVLAIRDLTMGGRAMAEIKILVPRSEVQYEDDVLPATEIIPESKIIVGKTKVSTFHLELTKEELDEFVKENNLNPSMVQNVLDGKTNSHKGFLFENK